MALDANETYVIRMFCLLFIEDAVNCFRNSKFRIFFIGYKNYRFLQCRFSLSVLRKKKQAIKEIVALLSIV